jgi:hypothetical protein
LLDTAGTRFTRPPEIRELDEAVRRAADERLRVELDELMEAATSPGTTGSDLQRLEASIRDQIEVVEADRDRALDDLIASDRELERLAKENAALHSDNRRLQARAGYWESAEGDESRERSPEEEFLAELRSEYESRFTASDRERYPLAPVIVGQRFLATLDQSDVPRAKAVQVSAEVASRRAREIAGRQVHPLRSSDAPNSGQRTRAHDGAEAWRCHIENRTPQAARLHWWVLGDTIELAAIVQHDDFDIPA